MGTVSGAEGAVSGVSGQPPMEEVDAALRAAVEASVTTEDMMHQAVRLRVAPETGAVAMNPLQVSMARRW